MVFVKIYDFNLPGLYQVIVGFSILRLLAITGYLYTMYRLSKALKTAETGGRPTFSDFAGDFLLFCFFPIGVWVLQPRIQALPEPAE